MIDRERALAAVFIGPFLALADLTAAYFLVHTGSRLPILLGHALAALGAIAGIVVARPALRGASPVDRFTGAVGVAINAFFLAVVVIGFGLPTLLLHPGD